MADRIKQIAFREFSLSEVQAGSPWNAIQSGATDAYVVKSILATQGSNTAAGAITATATVGLTTDFNNGKYASLGTIAKQDRIGVSGSQVVDANSTLTVRPVAKSINFEDKKFFVDTQYSTAPLKSRVELRGSVQGTQDISTATDIDKASVTFASRQYTYNGGSNAYSGQYTIIHTNANGVELLIQFGNNTTDGATFEVWNATTGVKYGHFYMNYGQPVWDGERYIYYFDENFNQIRYYDTDESTANLAQASTYGGGNGSNFYHGRINFNGSNPSGSHNNYDNHFSHFTIKDGKPYFFFMRGQQRYYVMAELPTTLTNYSNTANTTVKWVYLMYGSTSSTQGNFGSTNRYSMGYLMDAYGNNEDGTIRVTYDADIARWILYYNVRVASSTFVGTFTQADYDYTPSGSAIRGDGGTWGGAGYGLACLLEAEINEHLKIPSTYTSSSSSQGVIQSVNVYQNLKPYGDTWSWTNHQQRYWDGRKLYVANYASGDGYQYHIYELDLANDTATDITAGVSGNIPNYFGTFFMSKSTPPNATIASRTYASAPSLTVLISGVHEDRS